jgi:hypothetical protein
MGKLALYGTGAVLMGWPLIDFGNRVFNGSPVKEAAETSIYNAYGYSSNGNLESGKLRTGIIRTGLGAGAIMVARKL